jgi:hypothetical protein
MKPLNGPTRIWEDSEMDLKRNKESEGTEWIQLVKYMAQ